MADPQKALVEKELKAIEVKYLRVSADEGRSFLSAVQYTALVGTVKCLKDWPNGPGMDALDISPIDEFYELREKGGIYGKINVRVFFGYLPKSRLVFVLGAYKKEQEGQTPRHIVLKMRNRFRQVKTQYKE